MFVIPTHVGFTHRVVAMLVACSVVLWSVGAYTTAQAANLTSVSDTLTDSGPGALSGHLYSFTIPAGSSVASGDNIVINFDADFTGVAGVVSGDLTIKVNGSSQSVGTFTPAATSLTFNGVTAASSDVVTVAIAPGKIGNPATVQSYESLVTIANAPTNDQGRARVAIVDYVTVSAIVNTTFDFTVTGLGTSTSINGTSTTGSTTATLIPFGVLNANSIYTMAQRLNVTTNAIHGFVVTVEQDGNLRSSTGADIDSFTNGTDVNTPAAWSAPTNVLLDEKTWGHWGLTSNDSDLNSGEFSGGNKWVAASTTPRQVFAHNGPSNGVAPDIGQTEVGYQVQITPLQEAADDYTTTLMYVATPTF